ncbi:hypothetical protein [Azorhizobium sp. AG788]|uniref:hypothetical protein n=1 Tax=Azorhizobium sp. AG788 TaxID=2183897 RepID=UPI0010619CBA|nr:hypothetical protein [Azorhizobium sp. AG788]
MTYGTAGPILLNLPSSLRQKTARSGEEQGPMIASYRKALAVAALAAAAICTAAASAEAACLNPDTLNISSAWRRRTANADNQTLRDAYANGTCTWIAAPHEGGHRPACAAGTLHVTVSNGVRTCHVFRKQNTPACRDMDYFPATCL